MSFPYRYTDGAELIGSAAKTLLNNPSFQKFEQSLAEHNLLSIQDDQWYAVDNILKMFAEWTNANRGEASSNFVSVGIAVINNLPLPPTVEQLSFSEITLLLEQLYVVQHRNGEVGTITATKIGAKHTVYVSTSVYPDDLIYGYIWGTSRRFISKGKHFTVYYDPQAPRQDEGGESTTIHLTW